MLTSYTMISDQQDTSGFGSKFLGMSFNIFFCLLFFFLLETLSLFPGCLQAPFWLPEVLMIPMEIPANVVQMGQVDGGFQAGILL